jgi:hypothetical protein
MRRLIMMRLAELRRAADCWSLTGFDTVVNSFSDRAVDHLRIVFSPFAASASANVDNIVVDAVPVAGPIAGAGLPGLILAGGGLLG